MTHALLAAALVLAVALSGCASNPPPAGGDTTAPGGGSGGSGNTTANTTAPPRTVDLQVDSAGQYPVNPSFDPATLSAPAGTILHVNFNNADALPLVEHNWVLEGVAGAETDTVPAGAGAEATFPAPPPGEYAYFCSVGDHRERGMEGTLTIT